MTVRKISISPEYCSFYVGGERNVDIPIPDRGGFISTGECIVVPAQYYGDGDTNVTIGHFSDIFRADPPDFNEHLGTPQKKFVLFDAIEDNFATISVADHKTRIRIWIDHPTQPENVVIAWGD